MTKAGPQKKEVSDAKLDEAESIGKGLKTQKVAHDAGPHSVFKKLRELKPNLVSDDYYMNYEMYLNKKKGYTSQRTVAEQMGLSYGSVQRMFKRIEDEMEKLKSAGKPTQLDPYALTSGPDARYFQRRRIRAHYPIDTLAKSIGKSGIIDAPTILLAKGRKYIVDGFGRLDAWILADAEAGGNDKKPKLEYPVCLVIDCTMKEAAFIAFEKNRMRENFDEGDRDYSIVLMHENEGYRVNELAELANLDKSTISKIIHAWQDIPDDARKALEERKITTYHGRQLARAKAWPKEQARLTKWLLEEVEKARRPDAYFDYAEHFDVTGLSAGQFGMMVNSVVNRKKQAKFIADEVEVLHREGKLEDRISEKTYDELHAKMKKKLGTSSVTKKAMNEGLRGAGVKRETDAALEKRGKKPVSPATSNDSSRAPISVCANCTLAVAFDDEHFCPLSLTPDKNNECSVQLLHMGRPGYHRQQCPFCGGITVAEFLQEDVGTDYHKTKKHATIAHEICIIDAMLAKSKVTGKCMNCQNADCPIVSRALDAEMEIEVKHCPEIYNDRFGNERGMFEPRPKQSIKEINAEVQKQVDAMIAKAKATVSAGRAA
jgi:ParB-like chromosome segregation protein Spo0J